MSHSSFVKSRPYSWFGQSLSLAPLSILVFPTSVPSFNWVLLVSALGHCPLPFWCVCVGGGIFLFPLSCFPCLFALVCPLAVRCRLSFPCGRAMYMLRCETVSLSSHCYQVQDVCISGFVLSDAVSLSCMPELQVLYFWFCICVLDFHFLFMEQMPRTICL